MKKILTLIFVLAAFSAFAQHNSQNSLDWAGTYKGIMPCADCEGIRTIITLTEKNEFSVRMQYLGKKVNEYKYSGKVVWNSGESIITLITKGDNSKEYYFVGEGYIQKLDSDKKKIDGDLEEMFKLKKADEYELIVFDSGFDFWLNSSGHSISQYSNEYLRSMNISYVQEWNRRNIMGDRRFESYIDYDTFEDYNKDFNYKLFMYFKYFEEKNRLKLIPGTGRF